MRSLAPFLLMAMWCQYPASAQEEDAPEHPIVRHYPGASVESAEIRDYDAADVVTEYTAGPEPTVKTEALEGRLFKYMYNNDPKSSPLKVVRNYENALRKVGFATIIVAKGDKVEIPGVGSGDVFGAFRLDKNGAPQVYVNVKASTDTDYVWSEVLILEPQVMDQEYEAGAGELYDHLQKSGRVAVYGITFETGRATIQPESEKVLHEVQKLLEQHPDLKLRVEGHTDNVGDAASNQALSEARAAAVKTWVTGQGIEESRLQTAGFGDRMPVASNETDEGRARNRRVELVRAE